MHNLKIHYLILLLLSINLSCGDSNDDMTDESNNEIIDAYNLVAVNDGGEVFEIGNNTGNINKVGQLNKESDDTLLSTNCLIASNESIYGIEYIYNPNPTNNLLIYNRETETSTIVPLTIPETISGDEKGIVALAWDNGSLIGVLVENLFQTNSTKHLVSINLDNYLISDLGVTFEQDFITSIKKENSKVYISTWSEGLLEIDLNTNFVNHLSALNSSRMAVMNDSKIAIMESVIGSINGVRPEILDLNTDSVLDNTNDQSFGIWSVPGSTIIKDGIYLNIITSATLNVYLGILKTDLETRENTIVEIDNTNVSVNLIIVGTKDL